MICASQLQPPPRPSPAAVLADAYRAPKYRAACLPSPRAQAKPGAGRPSHSAPAHQTRTTALPPSRTDAKASRVDTSLSLLPMPKTKTRAAQVRTFRRLTYPAKPTRRLFAQLLKPLLICSSCDLLSTFQHTLHFFLPPSRSHPQHSYSKVGKHMNQPFKSPGPAQKPRARQRAAQVPRGAASPRPRRSHRWRRPAPPARPPARRSRPRRARAKHRARPGSSRAARPHRRAAAGAALRSAFPRRCWAQG